MREEILGVMKKIKSERSTDVMSKSARIENFNKSGLQAFVSPRGVEQNDERIDTVKTGGFPNITSRSGNFDFGGAKGFMLSHRSIKKNYQMKMMIDDIEKRRSWKKVRKVNQGSSRI